MVTLVNNARAEIKTVDGETGVIPLSVLSWAGKTLPDQGIGRAPKSVKEVLKPGDVIWAEKSAKRKSKTETAGKRL